jgi:nitrite reductase/ring-hydroxylating ferredoxin subunit
MPSEPPPPAAAARPGDAAESDWLFGFWYRALPGRKVRVGKMAKVTLLGVALVVGRDRTGRAFALRDACPHRGMPLSCGRFDGESIQCSFHGWKFDAQTGRCRLIPACTASEALNVGAIRAGHVPCEERDAFIWVYMQEPAGTGRPGRAPAASAPSAPPPLPVCSQRYRSFVLSGDMPVSADDVLALFVDPAHGPFVHRRWWLLARVLIGAFAEETRTNYEPIPLGFRESITAPVPDRWSRRLAGSDEVSVEADFVLPTLRAARIRFGRFWLTSLLTVTPVSRTLCRVDQVVAWEALYFMPFAALVMKLFFWLFFVQDRRAMARLSEGVDRIRGPMFVGDVDRPARWVRDLKRAFVGARRGDAEFRHPIEGPVMLTWRNADEGDV